MSVGLLTLHALGMPNFAPAIIDHNISVADWCAVQSDAPLESKPAKNTGTLDEIVFTDNAD